MPRVSVGLPVRNGALFLREAIDSLLAQTFADFELIICDNDSDDCTAEIALEYAQADNRVHYHRNDHDLGAVRNFNKTLALSRGQYFKWAACDDVHLPGYLARCVQALDADPELVLVYPMASEINEDGTERSQGFYPYDLDDRSAVKRFHSLLWKPPPYPHMMFGLIRASALMQIHPMAAEERGDYVMLAELALRGSWKQVDEMLFVSRRRVDRRGRTLHFLDTSLPDHPTPWRLRHKRSQMRAVRDSPLPAFQKMLLWMDVAACAVKSTAILTLQSGLRHFRRLR